MCHDAKYVLREVLLRTSSDQPDGRRDDPKHRHQPACCAAPAPPRQRHSPRRRGEKNLDKAVDHGRTRDTVNYFKS